jgi:hypothetical protein
VQTRMYAEVASTDKSRVKILRSISIEEPFQT